MKQLAYSRFRRALVPILVASLAVAALPAVHVEAKGPIRIAASELHGSLERQRTFALPLAASHLALHWVGQAAAQVTVAFSLDGRTFGPPIPVERDEVGEGRANGETYGNLLLAGGARFVRVTSDRSLAHLSVLDLDTRGPSQQSIGFGPVAAAAATQPAVISRAAWSADESLRFDGTGQEIWPPIFEAIQKLIVHHTATQNRDPNPAATVRAIYYYHAVTQGWGDIGYNFLIDEAGRIYEGRHARTYAAGESPTGEDAAGNGVTGAHALRFNSGSVGIALLGTLTSQDATPAARAALGRLLAWIAEGHRIDPHGSALYTNPVSGTQATFANIAGHRDVNATACPGGLFYATLPALRDVVSALFVYFTDLGNSIFFGDILWLADSGITSGCGGTRFCPDDRVTRGQMAAFLARALDLPNATVDYFTDDETSLFEADINRLAKAGITTGCGGGRYCPDLTITREQMAAYLDRALALSSTVIDYFTDDEASIFEASINRVAAAGITKGCTTTTYCPLLTVTRGQMAAFLHRAFGP